AEELVHAHFSHAMKFGISAGILILTLIYARVPALQAVGRRMRWVRIVLAWWSALVRFAFSPLWWALRLAIRLLGMGIAAIGGRRSSVAADPASDPPAPGSDGGV
ncbi:MAG: hypothetical protein QN123_14325, partial [Armatimonadota bacterium]|nr:hypothetical protein [Armatimonadota bacterium]